MKKDRKTAEFIRDKLVNLICDEYNKYDASIGQAHCDTEFECKLDDVEKHPQKLQN